MKALEVQIGCVYEFMYPRHNYDHVPDVRERRKLVVTEVRDTSLRPIEERAIDENPHLRRNGMLVTGIDLEKNSERSFYTGSMDSLTFVSDATTVGFVDDGSPAVFHVEDLTFVRLSDAEAAARRMASFGERPVPILFSRYRPSLQVAKLVSQSRPTCVR